MKKTLSFFAVATVLTAVSANAATTVVSGTTAIDQDITTLEVDDSATILFPSFDGSLGTLTSVTIKLTAAQRATVTMENDAVGEVTGSADLTGLVSVYFDSNTDGVVAGETFFATAGITHSPVDVTLQGTDNGGVANSSGTDFHNYGSIVSDPFVVSQTAVTGLTPFVGDGVSNLQSIVVASGGWSANGIGNATLKISDFNALASVEVTYTYSPVPEPSSALLGLLGAGALVFRRKRA